MSQYLGIDVSKATLDVALLRPDQPAVTGVFDHTPAGWQRLQHFLQKRKVESLWVCLEATGTYADPVALFLHDRGYTVSVVNPARIKAYADSRLSRNKTDASDAALIADFCRTQQPPAWTPPAPEQQELQAMVRHLANLQDMRQQEVNRRQSGVTSPTVLATLEQHIAFLEQQIADLKRQIQDHIDRHPHLRQQRDLLTSIPGIGNLTASKLLAEIRDITVFDDARQLAAFAGLTPGQYRSGTSVHRPTRLSKRGSSRLRAALYFPAIVAQQHNPILRAFAQRLLEAGKPKQAVIAAVMRKLLHQVFGILTSGQPFDPGHLEKSAALA